MATSDGISAEDWVVVHELAVEIVNAPDGESSASRKKLMDYLDTLECRYGPLPSILATRADYLPDDDPAKTELLLSAYRAAQASGDCKNQLLVAGSLADLYLERGELFDASRWLERMRSHSVALNNADYSEYERLMANYRTLALRKV